MPATKKRRVSQHSTRLPFATLSANSQPASSLTEASASAALHNSVPASITVSEKIDFDDVGDDTYDNKEEAAVSVACLQLNLTDSELFSMTASSHRIMTIVSKILPALSPSTPAIVQLRESIKKQLLHAPALSIPEIHASPTTWSSTNKAMDALWQEGVDGERLVTQDMILPDGADMREGYLVKSFGSLEDPLLILSSYPTADPSSTVHLEYSTTNDLFNSSMSRLHTKLGFHVANHRTSGALYVDLFPRRIDRKRILGNGESVLTKMPKHLLRYWEAFTFNLLDLSAAQIVIVSGRSAWRLFAAYLNERGIIHSVIWMYGNQHSRHELPNAYIEWADHKKTLIRRLSVVVYHPESLGRQRGQKFTNIQRNIAFRERLFDYVSAMVYGDVHLPTFLSTGRYYYQMSTGIIIPISVFEEYEEEEDDEGYRNNILAGYLRRPTLYTGTMDSFIRSNPTISAKKAAIQKLRKSVNVKPADAVAYWRRPDVVAVYGSYTMT